MRIVALAGLPGTGKSTLARALGRELACPVLDKDAIRAELFAQGEIEYSRAQDDLCCRVMYERAARALASGAGAVVLDGRTYSKRYQVTDLEKVARSAGVSLALVECVAREDVVRARLEHDARTGAHPAGNRSFGLYLALRAVAEPIERAKLVVDTSDGALEAHVARCLEFLQA